MLVLTIRNPEDLTTTYNKICLERSDSMSGVYSQIVQVDIDTTTQADGQSGHTSIIDNSGTSDKWYKVRFYSTISLVYSDYSVIWQGGTTELDSKIRRRVKDNNVSKYFFSNDEIADARDVAIQSLYPHTWIDTYYDVLITSTNKTVISLPSWITRMDDIMTYDTDSTLIGKYVNFYKIGHQLFPQASEFPTGYTFRIQVSKAYTDIAEVPAYYTDYLLDVAQMELLKEMEMDRARYYKYTTTIRPEGGNMPSLTRILERLETAIERKLTNIRRVRTTTEINLV